MDFAAARAKLIEHLADEVKDKRELDAMSRVPRGLFVPADERHPAYEDRPPGPRAQPPEPLDLTGGEKVLERGTGSGYQTAILAELAGQVVTVERVPELAASARKVLEKLGYTNIEVHLAEETLGWKQAAPYDAIIVTAGAPRVPDELLDQLAVGGRMVIPVGSRYVQELCQITKRGDRNMLRKMGGCRFVSLIGKSAWEN